MRNNGILNIDVARADLPMQPEYWIEETYVSRYEKLLRVIEKKTSFLPYRNTKVIREISFEVPASTTLEQIKENSNLVKMTRQDVEKAQATASMQFDAESPEQQQQQGQRLA